MKFDVVIAGGGFAGAYCARALARELGATAQTRVALVAQENVLTFQPMLAEVAGSSLSPLDVVNPLRDFCRGVNVLRGTIRAVDWAKKSLCLDAGRFTPDHVIEFEHLVIAIGSVVDFSQVPGMAQHGLPLKTVAHALRLRSAVINRLEEANLTTDPLARRHLLTFVVVGGGYTGVETAGQLVDLLQDVQELYSNLHREKIRVVLVHSRGHLLAEIGEKLGDYAQCVLESRGTEVRLNTRVIEVTADRAMLSDGSFIETHTILSTVGNATHPVVLDLCRQLTLDPPRGRIPTDAFMRVQGQTQLWAAGDCAAVPWGAEASPPTAQFASRQGVQLGRNLARVLQGGEPLPFSHRHLGQLATVGNRAAVAEIMGFRFSGFLAWWLWRSIYLAKLPGIARKLRVMIDWSFELFFPRDISLLLPPPEEPLRAVHYRQDAVIFARGTPVQGFFSVQDGRVEARRPGEPAQHFTRGQLLDGALQAADGTWSCDAVASEPTNVLLVRGLALELLRRNTSSSAETPPLAAAPLA
ncbi:MAG TPA: FAD-dependent oxidoreductase [Chthoniobacteraceae bacterium]|jgi:NADH dehydrogenase